MIRDRDQVYGERFSRQARLLDIREAVIAPRSPWQNAYAERVIGSIRRECLDHVVVVRRAASAGDSVFSKNKPILAINKMKDKTDWDEQEGMMHLLMGAVLAIRNPRAHGLFADDPESALEYIGFISMLAKRVDRAKRVTS